MMQVTLLEYTGGLDLVMEAYYIPSSSAEYPNCFILEQM